MQKLILPPKKCVRCGKMFSRKPDKSVFDFKEKRFCNKKCYLSSIKKENHPNWKGGKRISSEGYVRVSTGNGIRRFEHRLVMEKHLGRKLKKGEQVHHINENKLDNRIENLLLTKNGEHRKLYHGNAKRDDKGRFI